MKGTRISEGLYNMVKGWLKEGYSIPKIIKMLPDEVKVSPNTVRKIKEAEDYEAYCGIKKEEPEKPPEKVVQITPYAQTKEIVEVIGKTNILLESIFQIGVEQDGELKKAQQAVEDIHAIRTIVLSIRDAMHGIREEIAELKKAWQ